MALGGDDDVFEHLKAKAEPSAIADREAAQRLLEAQSFEKAQRRLAESVQSNSTQPVYLDSIRILGAPRTRNGFLKQLVQTTLDRNESSDLTLRSALLELQKTVGTLQAFDIFDPTIKIHLDTPPSYSPSTHSEPDAPIPLTAILAVKERSNFFLKSGTDLGNSEGSGYVQFTYRNLFGGAETLNFTGLKGTRTPSAYEATFTSPINASPLAGIEIKALNLARDNTVLASHSELSRGVSGAVKWLNPFTLTKQEVSYEYLWRTITGLSEDASPTVRRDAGDSVKSAITHTFTRDTRDNPLMPAFGTLLKVRNQIAGLGPLRGTIGHWRSEVESAVALPLGLSTGISWNASLRGGMLYPLSLSSQPGPKPSTIADRFHIGGANDVRGFHLGGLGPQSGKDSLGGDAYIAGSTSLLFPFPKIGKDSGLRFQAFVNGGRVLPLQRPPGSEKVNVSDGMRYTLSQLISEAPSLAAGVGIVYAHPVARFELNFCLPIGVRGERGVEGAERARKGLQFGVGIEFL